MEKERPDQPRGWYGQFCGLRVNCERVPRLPSRIVRRVLTDPRRVSSLLVWQERNGGISEALRASPRLPPSSVVELKRPDGWRDILETTLRPLPRNGGNALFLICPECEAPRRNLYAWRVLEQRIISSSWICRTCAGLRYASEGTYLPLFFRHLGGFPRTPVWDPVVCKLEDLVRQYRTSPEQGCRFEGCSALNL